MTPTTKPIIEPLDRICFDMLAQDTLRSIHWLHEAGDLEAAKNASADLRLATWEYLKGDHSGIWAYLHDYMSDETRHTLEALGPEQVDV